MSHRPPHHLTSSDNPYVKAIVRLGEHKHRRKEGLFVVESMRQLTRALEAGLRLREMMWCPDLVSSADENAIREVHDKAFAADAKYRGCTCTEALIQKMAYRESPEGLVAVFEQPAHSLDVLLDKVAAGGMCLVAVGIEKPGNLGAMARSCDGAGSAGLIVADGVVDAFNPNAIRASTGAVFTLPVVGAESTELIGKFRSRGIRIVTASPEASASLFQASLAGPIALVIGSEAQGLADCWRDPANGVTPVSIPMHGRVVDSLNASAAAAVLLFEAMRARMAPNGA